VSTERAPSSAWGQSVPWFTAALLVLLGSGLIAFWLNSTAANADRDTLNRGADAVQSAVEEQVRILELAGTGAASLFGQELDDISLTAMAGQIDITVLRSLLAVVTYPVDSGGVGEGEFLDLGLVDHIGFPVPTVAATKEEIDGYVSSGNVFFSAPFSSSDPSRLDYVVAMPVVFEGGLSLVGVVFRPDRMLAAAVAAAGESQYAVDAIDMRHDGQVIVSQGEPSSDLAARRSPDGVATALELVVRPGVDFPFAASPWLTPTVLLVGLVIALLLVWMGHMARARARDLADRLRFAQELNESKDRFLATVSHELRTPLTVVMGVATEIGPRWDTYADSDRQDLMKMMAEQAVEAANIVEDLLVAARSDPSRLRLAIESTDLKSHVEYAIASLPEEGRHRVIAVVDACTVSADTTRLRQILRNLLENAVRYGGDVITLDTRKTDVGVEIVVSDDGGNLAPEDSDRIFEPYERSGESVLEAPAGIGIGLYISRLLARLMNGELDCVCEDGYTRFRLTLPRAVSDPAPQVVDPEPALTT